jgi:hypothetical protein
MKGSRLVVAIAHCATCVKVFVQVSTCKEFAFVFLVRIVYRQMLADVATKSGVDRKALIGTAKELNTVDKVLFYCNDEASCYHLHVVVAARFSSNDRFREKQAKSQSKR